MPVVCSLHLLSQVDGGHVLVIAGIMNIDWKSFKIVLLREDEGHEIPLIIEVSKESIKLSSHINHETIGEEIVECESLAQNLSFKFYILTLDDKFKIALDDQFLCFHKFQSSLNAIKLIKVIGDITKVKQIDHRCVFPVSYPQLQADFPSIAFSADIPCLFRESTVIIIRAVLSGDHENGSFFIRFNEQGTSKQLLHFNPRFFDKCIVVNSMNDSLE